MCRPPKSSLSNGPVLCMSTGRRPKSSLCHLQQSRAGLVALRPRGQWPSAACFVTQDIADRFFRGVSNVNRQPKSTLAPLIHALVCARCLAATRHSWASARLLARCNSGRAEKNRKIELPADCTDCTSCFTQAWKCESVQWHELLAKGAVLTHQQCLLLGLWMLAKGMITNQPPEIRTPPPPAKRKKHKRTTAPPRSKNNKTGSSVNPPLYPQRAGGDK